ncbi:MULTISPECIES: GFA family protein [unclassified Acidovorax]|uniref:GFA family protein n=1 Tax=unclassified Acidovorax TaxID=2684926 RepID=UPI001C452FBF|nr:MULTISPECIES: GFA family protein [unclassified Acidovorax]MBV7427899.1 GFA family protein [Acidovorax sp. sif0732]MBV7449156.1 GFA family protein [Acidovorax sp. sif0715]
MTESVVHHRGSCLCGGVRYETTAPLRSASHCHCSMCRKAHGAAFASYGSVHREHHRFVQGQALLRAYRSSPRVTRQFCSACGSPLLWHSEGVHADSVAVPLGTLDTPFDAPPQRHIHVASKAAWVVICDGYPQIAGE